MADSDNYDEMLDEDLSALEDNPQEDERESVIPSGELFDALTQDTPVYRLHFSYSKESFLAAWTGGVLAAGASVIVPTRYGRDLAKVVGAIQRKPCQTLSNIAKIERVAGADDLSRAAANEKLEQEAFDICRKKIEGRRLDMKLVSVHYLLDEPKILFFFTAESRVDFRELVKDLVNIFKIRIELRQIGVRDESRDVGGLGVCGRGYCCHTVSDKLKPVSIKMAKEQNLSLNTMKISGPCGRLLCCLAYEHLFYGEQRRLMPNEGSKINWDDSIWKVAEVNVATGKVRLAAEDGRVIQLPAASFVKTDGRWTVRHVPCE